MFEVSSKKQGNEIHKWKENDCACLRFTIFIKVKWRKELIYGYHNNYHTINDNNIWHSIWKFFYVSGASNTKKTRYNT